MTEASIAQFVSELSDTYAGTTVAQEGTRTLVKLQKVFFPSGCQPASVEALIVLDPAQPKPRLLIKAKPKTSGGAEPRNVSPETAGGEAWFSFSFNLGWDPERHAARQFVEGALRRFAKNE